VELTTDQKGAIAEAAVVLAAIKLGVPVYRPVAEGLRHDMIFLLGGRVVRIQCKWASRYDDIIVVRAYSARRTGNGLTRRRYTSDEVDAFAVYCAELDRCFFLPIAEFRGKATIHLRLSVARNNQAHRVNWADEYEFTARLGASGAIAQLGERRRGTPKVAGSSPAGSISEGS
jgi:PD-(D/E)XK endonuclease